MKADLPVAVFLSVSQNRSLDFSVHISSGEQTTCGDRDEVEPR